MGYKFGYDDLLSIPTAGAYSAAKAATGGTSLLSKGGDAVDDFMSQGQNTFQAQPYQAAPVNWGGEGGADAWAQGGLIGSRNASQQGNYAFGQMQGNRGPQAWENADLANREAQTRGGDQAGALQLSREAAMGMAPSEAAYQMQQGLDRGIATQQAQMGSARGAAGVAMAGANAANNTANLQNQTFMQAGQLRAQEMAQARGAYNDMSNQVRGQDQNRLGQGNQMSQFNAGANDQYKLGMGGLANQFGNQAQGWYNGAQNPYNQQGSIDNQGRAVAADSYNNAQSVNAGTAQQRADARQSRNDRYMSLLSTGIQAGGSMAGAGGGGGK